MSLTVMRPLSSPWSSTIGSFSMRWRHRMSLASSRVVPSGRGHQRGPAHDVGDGLVDVLDEAQVAVGEQAHEVAGRIGDGHARDVVAGHHRQGFGHQRLGGERHRVDDHARLAALDLVDLGHLVVDGEVAVDDADAAGAGQRDGERGLGDGVHGRRDDRYGQFDRAASTGWRCRPRPGGPTTRRAAAARRRRSSLPWRTWGGSRRRDPGPTDCLGPPWRKCRRQ